MTLGSGLSGRGETAGDSGVGSMCCQRLREDPARFTDAPGAGARSPARASPAAACRGGAHCGRQWPPREAPCCPAACHHGRSSSACMVRSASNRGVAPDFGDS
jgi:hypothetical protein